MATYRFQYSITRYIENWPAKPFKHEGRLFKRLGLSPKTVVHFKSKQVTSSSKCSSKVLDTKIPVSEIFDYFQFLIPGK